MEDKTGKEIPQVGSGIAGESHSSIKEDRPMDSGGDNRPLPKLPAQMVGNQAIPAEIVTGRERGLLETGENINPFKRRDSITRSPPMLRKLGIDTGRQRSGSCSDTNSSRTGSEGNASKRKRAECSGDSPNSKETKELADLIRKLNEDASALDKEVEATYKPKREFKNLASSILLWAKELQRKIQNAQNTADRGGQNLIENEAKDQEKQLLLAENKKLQEQIQYLEMQQQIITHNQIDNLSHVRCQQCEKLQKTEARKQILQRDKTFDGFQQVTEEDWQDEVFPRIQVKQGHIWEAPIEYTLILPCSKDIRSNQKEVKKAIENFGGQEGLKKQNKTKGEVAAMVHSLGFPEHDGKYIHISREIYYPILTDGGINEKVEDGNIYQALETVKTLMTKHSKNRLAIPEMEDVTGLIITRMIEFLFVDTNIEIVMYKPNYEQSKVGGPIRQAKGGGNTAVRGANTNAKKNKPKPEALLIKMRGKTYAELLKTMKQTVNPSQIGVDIKEVRKTKNGELLVTLQNGDNKADILKKEISEKMPGAITSLLTNKRVIHIKDLDGVVTEEEIRDTISRSISAKPETLEVKALRPAYASKQNVTVVMTDPDAEKLIQMKKIKIGWTSCRILERKKETKCYKCWKYGHIKEQCSGPDRGNMCLKCGQAGHKAADCKNKAFCVFCNEEGHQSGNQRCPKNGSRQTQPVENQ